MCAREREREREIERFNLTLDDYPNDNKSMIVEVWSFEKEENGNELEKTLKKKKSKR